MIFQIELTQINYTVLPYLIEINKKRRIDMEQSTTTTNNKINTNNSTGVDMELQKKLKMDTTTAKSESICKPRPKVHFFLLVGL